jgi:hypothetical protein
MAEDEGTKTAGFQIFRAKDAPGLMEAKCMTVEPYSPTQREVWKTAKRPSLNA